MQSSQIQIFHLCIFESWVSGELEDSFLISGIDFHFLNMSVLICIET